MLASLVIALGLQLAPVTAPSRPPELVPGTTYDSRIPTLKEVTGHALDEEVATPEDIVKYFEALAKAAPDRTRMVTYARSWKAGRSSTSSSRRRTGSPGSIASRPICGGWPIPGRSLRVRPSAS